MLGMVRPSRRGLSRPHSSSRTLLVYRISCGVEHLARLPAGFPDFGITINAAKTKANFQAVAGGVQLRKTYQAGDAEFVQWCGLLVNSATLELQADYTRYTGQHLAGALGLNAQRVRSRAGRRMSKLIVKVGFPCAQCTANEAPSPQAPGKVLAAKLRAYLRPKCHPVLLDGTINTPMTVRLNIYQVRSRAG